MSNIIKERSASKKLRVKFPDGTIICYTSSKQTFLETLRKIGGEKLGKVTLESGHLPLFTKTIYPLYERYMEPVGDGWYIKNGPGSDSNIKYAQLMSINKQLNLGLEIDLSNNFKGNSVPRGSKGICVLQVEFPDGTIIGEKNAAETFIQCIWNIGIENVRKLNLKYGGKDLIAFSKLYNNQVQIDTNKWLVVPSLLKDKVKLLNVIGAMLHINFKITSFSSSETGYKRIGK